MRKNYKIKAKKKILPIYLVICLFLFLKRENTYLRREKKEYEANRFYWGKKKTYLIFPRYSFPIKLSSDTFGKKKKKKQNEASMSTLHPHTCISGPSKVLIL